MISPNSSRPRAIKLTTTSYVVLGMIALRGPSTSYDLKRAVGHSVGYFWLFPHAQLYSEPVRLVSAGLLQVEEEEKQGRRRRTYSITDSGRTALEEWLREPTTEVFQIRNVAEIKLFYAELGNPDDLAALAHQQVESHRKRLAIYEDMQERFGAQPELSRRLVPLALGIELEQAALKFWESLKSETKELQ